MQRIIINNNSQALDKGYNLFLASIEGRLSKNKFFNYSLESFQDNEHADYTLIQTETYSNAEISLQCNKEGIFRCVKFSLQENPFLSSLSEGLSDVSIVETLVHSMTLLFIMGRELTGEAGLCCFLPALEFEEISYFSDFYKDVKRVGSFISFTLQTDLYALSHFMIKRSELLEQGRDTLVDLRQEDNVIKAFLTNKEARPLKDKKIQFFTSSEITLNKDSCLRSSSTYH